MWETNKQKKQYKKEPDDNNNKKTEVVDKYMMKHITALIAWSDTRSFS
eukprot:gene8954-6282_t